MSRQRKRWLRRLAWAGTGLAALLLAGYGYVTDPERLRSRALEALRALHVDGVDLAGVTFSPRTGLELHGLVFVPPEPSAARRPTSRLRVGRARANCGWLQLLLGRLRPTDVELSDVAITFVCDPSVGGQDPLAAQAEARSQAAWDALTACRGNLPRVTLTDGDLQVMVVEGGRARLLERLRLRAAGAPTPTGYKLRVDRISSADQPLAEAQWTAAAGELTVALDWTGLDVAAQLLPPRVADVFERLELAGRAHVERLVLHTRTGPADSAGGRGPELKLAEVSVADARCVLPLEATEQPPPIGPVNHFLRLTETAARLTYHLDDPAVAPTLQLDLSGQLNGSPATFSLTLAGQAITRLWTGAEPLSTALSLDDVRQAELRVAGFDLPTPETYPEFVSSPLLPHPVVAALREYQPRGKVNLRFSILPSDTTGDQRVDGEIEALGSSCRYFRFPYAFQDARGRLRFSGGQIIFDGLCGRHGSAWVRADGVVNNTRSWTGLTLVFRGQNVALDADLYAALPESYRRLWENAAPIGLCDVTTCIARPEGAPETGAQPAAVQVQARLLGGSLALGNGQRLDHVDGQLLAQNDTIHVDDLHGYQGPAAVRLDGDLHLVGGDVLTNLGVEIADLPIEHTAALVPGAGEATPQLRLTGRADVWGRVGNTADTAGRSDSYTVHIKDGELTGRDPARRWTDARGWITVRGALRRVISFACRQDAARFEAAGTLPGAGAPDGVLDLDLHAGAPAVEELPPQFLPPDWLRVTDALGAAGAGEVRVRLHGPGQGLSPGAQTAEIDLRAARLKPQLLPLDLRDAAARATLAPGRCDVQQATARWGETGQVEARGSGTWQAGQWQTDFTLSARGLAFTPELIDALPAPLSRLLKRLSPRGAFDLLLSRVHAVGGQAPAWELQGSLPLKRVALHMGLDLTDADGELTGSAAIGPDRDLELNADFTIRKGVLASQPIERWEGQLRHARGDRWVRLDDLRGRLCGGEALGAFQIDPETGEYQLSLTLQDVSAAELLPAPKERPERSARGRVDGRIYVRGKGAEAADRQGGGEVRIRGSSFLQTPLLASLARAGRPAEAPISDAVDRAEVRFLLEGHAVRVVRIDIQSRDLRLVGEGTWNLRDDALCLTLVGAHPENWPRVAVLSDLLESAGQKLVQYRVEGTLSAPRVTTEPLHDLNAALRQLLRENAD